MPDIDFKAHNEESKAVWKAYKQGHPIRVPVMLGVNVRYYLFTPWLNPGNITFQEYTEDLDLMIQTQLEFQDYVRHNLVQDADMGLPEKAWSPIIPDLQNYYEAGWFGCPVRFHDGQVPDTQPILHDDNKRMLFDRGIPDPFTAGVMARCLEYTERIAEKTKTLMYKGLPIAEPPRYVGGTDGPFTAAANLRGATEVCIEIYEDPEYVKELLSYITEATIVRIREWRKKFGRDENPKAWGFADDSIQLLSTEVYKEFVLPCHKRLLSELAGPGPHSVHLCGDATRHFPTIRDELNVNCFDTGFPVDFGALRKSLGKDVAVFGGPSVQFLLHSTPQQVREEVRRILSTGITEGGRFVLREGNNLSPGTPEKNIEAMYQAAREFGRY